jgi:hypothetical protein
MYVSPSSCLSKTWPVPCIFFFFFINSKTSHVFLDYFSLFGFIRQFLSQFLLLFYVARKTTCLLHCVLYILVSICINLY